MHFCMLDLDHLVTDHTRWIGLWIGALPKINLIGISSLKAVIFDSKQLYGQLVILFDCFHHISLDGQECSIYGTDFC